ncbi:hypothetical protein ACO03V_01340 [Microbacterium sp. HMH0099]|uniref:hypothetical protein n=1 Tax=Microbacterium sp. HMH0099 TaxID=3414026 RepID=UPI003BF67605
MRGVYRIDVAGFVATTGAVAVLVDRVGQAMQAARRHVDALDATVSGERDLASALSRVTSSRITAARGGVARASDVLAAAGRVLVAYVSADDEMAGSTAAAAGRAW